METKTKNSSTTSNKTIKSRSRPAASAHSAPEKAQAVLAVWTERCKAAEVCRQLGIRFMTFQHWQRRAMEGMLQALESGVNLARGEALSPRLQALLRSRQQRMNTRKLTQRLEQIQLAKEPESLPKTA